MPSEALASNCWPERRRTSCAAQPFGGWANRIDSCFCKDLHATRRSVREPVGTSLRAARVGVGSTATSKRS